MVERKVRVVSVLLCKSFFICLEIGGQERNALYPLFCYLEWMHTEGFEGLECLGYVYDGLYILRKFCEQLLVVNERVTESIDKYQLPLLSSL